MSNVFQYKNHSGHSGDGCVLALTLCKYTLRKGDLFVLSWAMARRVRRGSISSELLMCGGGVRSILLLPLVARFQETIDICIWRMFVILAVLYGHQCQKVECSFTSPVRTGCGMFAMYCMQCCMSVSAVS